ncbi:hypothetical protein Dsin_014173 [Dipteronia sinensis]|uniref:PGG domain-containing protein n=1 Tax=Dipteronia sinensis TaxID=43782 RepID=A0AAE0ALT9_9ROSI|nr:hypothetical protein Dsin_014173 [Dipteronia sinensis]
MSQQHESGVAQSNVNPFLQPNHDNVPSGISNKPQLSQPQIEVGECSSSGISEQEPRLSGHIEFDESSSSGTSDEQEPQHSQPQIEVGECSSSGISEQEPQLSGHIEIDECSSSGTSDEQEPQLSQPQIEVGECSCGGISEQESQLSGHIEIDECSSSDTSDEQEPQHSQPQSDDVKLSDHSYYCYLPLINAAQRGDWKSFVHEDPKAWKCRITSLSQTALHVAAISCQWGFVLKLLEVLPPESITVQDEYGNTALHYVAAGGSLKTAKALVTKNSDLPQMTDKNGHLPLITSIWSESNKELAWYLSSVTKVNSQSTLLLQILHSLIQSGYHDIALHYIEKYPELAIAIDEYGHSLLFWLAENPSHFFSQSNLGFLERLIYKFVHVELQYSPTHSVNMENIKESTESETALQSTRFETRVLRLFKRLLWKANAKKAPSVQKVRDAKLKHKCAVVLINHVCKQLSKESFEEILHFLRCPNYILGIAIKGGIEEIVRTLLQHFPDLIYYDAIPERNIFQTAIEYRQEKIVKIIKEVSPTIVKALCAYRKESNITLLMARKLAPKESNTTLLMAGKLAPKESNTTLLMAGKLAPAFKLFSVSGAALQMQRELQWFKEVENITFPNLREWKNMEDETAKDVFRKEHKELAEQGEKWMKDTADSCMLVSTLIATVLFAAAFTIPGGIINDKGIPIFLRTNTFTLFAISDTLGLFSSLTSLLMFLAILTSRYEVEDFLESLPKKLIIGLGSLFLAIAAMIIAFGAALTIILSERWNWVYVPVTILASIPVIIFVRLQLPLFVQMVRSTYGFSIFRLDCHSFE